MRRALLMISAIATVLLFSAPVSALAAGSSGPADQACVAWALPAGSTATPSVTCYATFAQSISAATSGRVQLPADAAPASVTPDQLNAGPAAPDTTYVLSIDWMNNNFSGPSLTWSQSSKCGSFQAGSMPSGWNNDVSSVANYSGCATTMYNGTNFSGTKFSVGKNGTASSLGSFNDEASSQKWCTSAPC